MKVFKQVEVSSKYHSLNRVILNIQLYEDQIVIETLKYSITVSFDSIASLKNDYTNRIDIIVNDNTVLSNIYLNNMQRKNCELLIFRYENYKK